MTDKKESFSRLTKEDMVRFIGGRDANKGRIKIHNVNHLADSIGTKCLNSAADSFKSAHELVPEEFQKRWNTQLHQEKHQFYSILHGLMTTGGTQDEHWARGVIDCFYNLAKALGTNGTYMYRGLALATEKPRASDASFRGKLPPDVQERLENPTTLTLENGTISLSGNPDYIVVTFPDNEGYEDRLEKYIKKVVLGKSGNGNADHKTFDEAVACWDLHNQSTFADCNPVMLMEAKGRHVPLNAHLPQIVGEALVSMKKLNQLHQAWILTNGVAWIFGVCYADNMTAFEEGLYRVMYVQPAIDLTVGFPLASRPVYYKPVTEAPVTASTSGHTVAESDRQKARPRKCSLAPSSTRNPLSKEERPPRTQKQGTSRPQKKPVMQPSYDLTPPQSSYINGCAKPIVRLLALWMFANPVHIIECLTDVARTSV